MPPCEEGVFTSMRQVFMRLANSASFSFSVIGFKYIEDVCP